MNTKMNGQGHLSVNFGPLEERDQRPQGGQRPSGCDVLPLFLTMAPWVVPRPLHVLHSSTDFPLVPNALWQSNQGNTSLKENSFTKQASGVLDGIALLWMEIVV